MILRRDIFSADMKVLFYESTEKENHYLMTLFNVFSEKYRQVEKGGTTVTETQLEEYLVWSLQNEVINKKGSKELFVLWLNCDVNNVLTVNFKGNQLDSEVKVGAFAQSERESQKRPWYQWTWRPGSLLHPMKPH